jgi:hypothetical protein
MLSSHTSRFGIILTAILIFCFQSASLAETRKGDTKTIPSGTKVMWVEPTDIQSRDLYLGPGGKDMQPDTSNLTFISKVNNGGYSTKYRVRDAQGRVWVAKVGAEAQSETAAVRLMWAIGYTTEINYLVPSTIIPGVGMVENVRFEARPTGLKRVAAWQWADNPFRGTREFQGLKTMMMLLNNWDIKDDNNVIIYDKSSSELRYAISDLGATFGKTGKGAFWIFNRSRNKPEDFVNAKFILKVQNGRLDFANGGKQRSMFDDITVEDARWVGSLLAKLSDDQLRDAFRAANYNRDQVDTLTRGLKSRIRELLTISDGAFGIASR